MYGGMGYDDNEGFSFVLLDWIGRTGLEKGSGRKTGQEDGRGRGWEQDCDGRGECVTGLNSLYSSGRIKAGQGTRGDGMYDSCV